MQGYSLKRSLLFLALCSAFLAPLRADTPTFTPTDSPTVTVGDARPITPGVGDGTWGLVTPAQCPLVAGSAGNTAVLTYNNGPAVWDPGDGLLTILFPNGLSAPSPQNFYAQPTYSSYIGTTTIQTSARPSRITVESATCPPGGFLRPLLRLLLPTVSAVSTTNTPLSFSVMAPVPSPPVLGHAVAPWPSPRSGLVLVVVTTRPRRPPCSSPISQTLTVSPTFSHRPCTVSPTIPSPSRRRPSAPCTPNAVYSYPNPFDLQGLPEVHLPLPRRQQRPGDRLQPGGRAGARDTCAVTSTPPKAGLAILAWAWTTIPAPRGGGPLLCEGAGTPSGLYAKHFTALH